MPSSPKRRPTPWPPPDSGPGPVYLFQTGVADPDVMPLAQAGVPAATLRLDGSEYLDYHHSADDTLDKVDPRTLGQSTAAHAVFAYLAAELGADYRAAGTGPRPPAPAH